MEPTEGARAQIALLINDAWQARYESKKEAYSAIDMHQGTWASVESGASVSGPILRRVVRFFWPETNGDWTRIPNLVLGDDEIDRLAMDIIERQRAYDELIKKRRRRTG
jgi:hypothetical protein